MINMNRKLLKWEAEGKTIKVGVIGAGQMGRSMTVEMVRMHGIKPVVLCDMVIENAINAFKSAGVAEDDIARAKTLEEANRYAEAGRYVVCEDYHIVTNMNCVECVVDVTGHTDLGAHIGTETITNHKHYVIMNVETDVVIGPYLYKLARDNGVLYSGTAGDEPGAVMELYDFACAMGLDVKVMGKGKNNRLARECNPDTVLEEATRRKMSPRMLCAFKDGTKTMVEMAAMSNATGLVPDVIGGHGIACDVKGLNDMYRLKEDGGILNRHGVVEFVNGIAPGVFVTVSTDNDEIAYQMGYHSMGPGPLWTLYRPYHLCNLETPLTIAKMVIDGETTIVPKGNLVSEVITVAKKDLKAGELIDGIGGFTTYGSIATKEESDAKGYIPYGLITKGAKMLKDAKKGQLLTMDMMELDTSTLLYKIRKEQDTKDYTF